MSLTARLLFGSQRSQIGWLILAFGSFFFWAFTWFADISGWRFRDGRAAETRGQASGCRQTRFSEGGTKNKRGTPIFENHYRYEVSGQTFEGSSFAKGQCVNGPVVVEYLPAQPEVSRIRGMRRRPLSAAATLTALMPAAGIVMILAGLVEGRRRLRLLREGLLTTGRLVEKKRTNVRTRGRRVYRLTFEFTAQSGMTGRVNTRTRRPERLEDKAGQILLYDPANLKRAVLLASLPGRISADESRQPVARGSMAFLLLPALSILGNVWCVYRLWIAGS